MDPILEPSLPGLEPYYHDGLITIYRGDCQQIAPRLAQVDLLLTDPPYGIGVCPRGTIESTPTERSRRKSSIRAACTRFEPVTWDSAPPASWLLQMLMDRARWAVLWGGNYYSAMSPSSCWLVWDKKVPTGVGFADCELAWTNLRRAVRVFRWRWSGMLQEDMSNKELRVHPTQKPVPLMTWCIGLAKGVRSILDPFMGSGSTLIAAQRLGIRAIGIDQHEPYCASAVARLQEDRLRFPPGSAEPNSTPLRPCSSNPVSRLSSGGSGPVPVRPRDGWVPRKRRAAKRSCRSSGSGA